MACGRHKSKQTNKIICSQGGTIPDSESTAIICNRSVPYIRSMVGPIDFLPVTLCCQNFNFRTVYPACYHGLTHQYLVNRLISAEPQRSTASMCLRYHPSFVLCSMDKDSASLTGNIPHCRNALGGLGEQVALPRMQVTRYFHIQYTKTNRNV